METNQTPDMANPDVSEAVNQQEADAFYGESQKELEKPAEEKNNKTIETSSTKEEDTQSESSSESPSNLPSEDSKDSDKVAEGEDEKSEKAEDVEYKLSLGEDSYLSEKDVKSIEAFAKENGISNEAAQTLLKQQESTIAEIFQAQYEAHERKVTEWLNEVKSDPVMGGDNLRKTSEGARRVVEKFGSENFIQILNDTGYGNNPHVVRFLSGIADMMSEDTFVTGGRARVEERSVEDIFYGN